MRTTFGTPRLSVHELGDEQPLTVFRIVTSDERGGRELLDALRSHYELGSEPRRVERRSPVLHMGISVFTERTIAAGVARRWPRLGRFIARLELGDGVAVNYADTGGPGHLTLWGDPVKLRDAIADIEPISP
jgi:hypothetical protein